MIHSIYRDDEIIVALNGIPYTVSVDDPRYDEVVDAAMNEDEELLESLLSIKGRSKIMFDDLEEEGLEEVCGDYFYKGNQIAMDLNDYLGSALNSGNYMPVVRFIQRLYENPNQDTRGRLFTFMDNNKMPIDSQGRFLAFKGVRDDYRDHHSGTIDNAPGSVVPRMSWSEVDTDSRNTCSRGYHACSKDYFNSGFFNAKVVSVAIAPEDVGAVPADYNDAKLRCRQYEVIADITDQFKEQGEKIKIRGRGYLAGDGDYNERVADLERDFW